MYVPPKPRASPSELTRLALRTLEDALAQAAHGPVIPEWWHGLALACLLQGGIADEFHQHTGGQENRQSSEQPHATGTPGVSTAPPSPDPLGNGVPIASGAGQAAMQDARRR
jgi:hypothetical protein